jgi:hypothetical protein
MTNSARESRDRGQMHSGTETFLGGLVAVLFVGVLVAQQLMAEVEPKALREVDVVCNCAGPWWSVGMAPVALIMVALFIISVGISGGLRVRGRIEEWREE